MKRHIIAIVLALSFLHTGKAQKYYSDSINIVPLIGAPNYTPDNYIPLPPGSFFLRDTTLLRPLYNHRAISNTAFDKIIKKKETFLDSMNFSIDSILPYRESPHLEVVRVYCAGDEALLQNL